MIRKILCLLLSPSKLSIAVKTRLAPLLRRSLERVGIDSMSRPYGVDSMQYHLNFMRHFDKIGGFFIEIGGHDGYFHSPTYYLERFRRWKGILVEPIPPLAEQCARERRRSKVYNCACVSDEYEGEHVTINNCNHSSHVDGSLEGGEPSWVGEMQQLLPEEQRMFQVEARTLTSLLDEYFSENDRSDIDLIVLDVEEYELSVLHGLDFSRYAPGNFLVESHTPEFQKEIESYLNSHGYELVERISSHDYLYSLPG